MALLCTQDFEGSSRHLMTQRILNYGNNWGHVAEEVAGASKAI